MPNDTPRQQLIEPRKKLFDLLDHPQTKKKFEAVLPKVGLTADKMLRLGVNAVRKTPRLMDCEPGSVIGSLMAAAALGLEPNTPLQHAYLIPYADRKPKKDANGEIVLDARGRWVFDERYECQFIIGYRGYIVLARRNKALVKFVANAVHRNDVFEQCEGSEAFLKHKFSLEDPGPLVAAYAYARFQSEYGPEDSACVLPLAEMHKIRSRSTTYASLVKKVDLAKSDRDRQKAEATLADTPWVMWEDQMAAKSAIRRMAKQMPLSPDVDAANALEDAADRGTLDLEALQDPELIRQAIEGEGVPEREPVEDDAPQERPALTQSAERPMQEVKPTDAEPVKAERQQKQSAKPKQQDQPKPDPKPETVTTADGTVADAKTGEIVDPPAAAPQQQSENPAPQGDMLPDPDDPDDLDFGDE